MLFGPACPKTVVVNKAALTKPLKAKYKVTIFKAMRQGQSSSCSCSGKCTVVVPSNVYSLATENKMKTAKLN